ncbi:hypothetical protein [Streptomyces sp. NPDC001401]|uniref:hypothetical protein n=1 Tax=Streptomyces sp. NPDC001401 TaxID=3364570 RepID=UPI0036C13F6C
MIHEFPCIGVATPAHQEAAQAASGCLFAIAWEKGANSLGSGRDAALTPQGVEMIAHCDALRKRHKPVKKYHRTQTVQIECVMWRDQVVRDKYYQIGINGSLWKPLSLAVVARYAQ